MLKGPPIDGGPFYVRGSISKRRRETPSQSIGARKCSRISESKNIRCPDSLSGRSSGDRNKSSQVWCRRSDPTCSTFGARKSDPRTDYKRRISWLKCSSYTPSFCFCRAVAPFFRGRPPLRPFSRAGRVFLGDRTDPARSAARRMASRVKAITTRSRMTSHSLP